MVDYFLDTSALVKRYIPEKGTAWVKSISGISANNIIVVTQITPIEVIAAVQKRMRQGVANHGISPGAAANARLLFRKDMPRFFQLALTSSVLQMAERLPLRHKLRAYDAIQLAAALEASRLFHARNLPIPVFVSADDDLNFAAEAEGFVTDNPNVHP